MKSSSFQSRSRRSAGELVGLSMMLGVLAGGCTSYGPSRLEPGSSREAALASMGAPTGEHPRAEGGVRLEYARGPFGQHTWMLDYDAQGRLLRVEQVLTEANFSQLRRGMSEAEVLYAIGRPSHRQWLPRQQHRLWSYRYESPFCQWFQVSLNRTGRVAELGYGPDPLCETKDSGSP